MWLWYSLYGIEWIRRYLRTPPPESGIAGYMTPAMWEWRRSCVEWNKGYLGPRRECDSPDPRWPLNAHDEKMLLLRKRQMDAYRALGYTWVRPEHYECDESYLAHYREWYERRRRYAWA
jgi:hypothetical protein